MKCCVLFVFILSVMSAAAAGQLTTLEPDDKISGPGMQERLDQAKRDFAAERWPEAFREFSALHEKDLDDPKISEYLAEAALNTGNGPLAISLMEPVRKASPARWMASALLARAYAEANRDAERDAELANLQHLHDTKFAPRIAQLQTILLERRVTPNGTVRIWYGLEPTGKFKTWVFARIYDAQGVETYHVTLDSSDIEQVLWAKEHPKEAAAGERVFFLDGYNRPQKLPNGGSTSTQALLGIYDGRPAYDVVRDRILAIAAGKAAPIATASPH
jgi:hypothetical protein